MYSQNNVWLEKKNEVTFHLTSLPGDKAIAIRIEDSTYGGHLEMHIDKEVVPDFIECLQKINLEDKK